MELKRTTDATVEPVTTAEARAHLRIDGADFDTQIDRWIASARRRAEDFTGRQFITATWTMKLDGFPAVIRPPRPPLIAVASVKYTDNAGVEQALVDGTDYDVTSNTEWRGKVLPSYGKAWPSPRVHTNVVEVIYTAGYGATAADVPAEIVMGILAIIGVMSEYPEGVTAGGVKDIPWGGARALLYPFREMEGV